MHCGNVAELRTWYMPLTLSTLQTHGHGVVTQLKACSYLHSSGLPVFFPQSHLEIHASGVQMWMVERFWHNHTHGIMPSHQCRSNFRQGYLPLHMERGKVVKKQRSRQKLANYFPIAVHAPTYVLYSYRYIHRHYIVYMYRSYAQNIYAYVFI